MLASSLTLLFKWLGAVLPFTGVLRLFSLVLSYSFQSEGAISV
jgi:hypothetical protein